jgi:hypothetical protein
MRRTLVGLAVLGTLIMGGAASSWAAGSFHAAANCKQVPQNAASPYNGTLGINYPYNQLYDSGSGDTGVLVICPVSAGSVVNEIVSAWANGAGQIKAQLCVESYAGNTPNCGPTASASVGLNHLPVSWPSAGFGTQDYTYLQVQLYDGNSTFWGYTIN